MTSKRDPGDFATGLIDGRRSPAELDLLSARDRNAVIDQLLTSAAGRRWLRNSELLDANLAHQLLEYGDDFRQSRRDSSLDPVIGAAEPEQLVARAGAVAAGSAAPVLWTRLAPLPEALSDAVDAVLASEDSQAIEATATHLLLDPANPYRIDAGQRERIAAAILETDVDSARGVAAEFLSSTDPERLASDINRLARDVSVRVRGFSWLAAFRVDRDRAMDRAAELLGDESLDVDVRRSALNTAGEVMSTDRVIELLAYFVIHPSEALALDAANLLHRHHRHPDIAIAAAGSPHEAVREIANRLMDPYRGSPAAGGSRPGDPLRTDPLLKIMRQIEDEKTRE
ncbi:MAG: hypothetical protein R3A46_07325 [Thermomicrobiales bacterium]